MVCSGISTHDMVFLPLKIGTQSHSSSESLSLTSGNESGRHVKAGSRPMPREIVLSQQYAGISATTYRLTAPIQPDAQLLQLLRKMIVETRVVDREVYTHLRLATPEQKAHILDHSDGLFVSYVELGTH